MVKGPAADRLSLRNVPAECIIGVYAAERRTLQPLELDLHLRFNSRIAARSGQLSTTVDYAHLTQELRFILQAGQFALLEAAAAALAAYVLAPLPKESLRATITEVRVHLRKPLALLGRGVPEIVITRCPHDFAVDTHEKTFGRIEELFANSDCTIARVRLSPGAKVTLHELRNSPGAELLLDSGIGVTGVGQIVCYENPSSSPQTLLCIERRSADKQPAGEEDFTSSV